MMTQETFSTLLKAYHSGNITDAQRKELRALLHTPERTAELESLMTTAMTDPEMETIEAPETLALVYERLLLEINPPLQSPQPVFTLRRSAWWAAAAVLLIVAGVFVLRLFNQSRPGNPMVAKVAGMHDIAPGRDGARLTLFDGKSILVDTLKDGLVTVQGGVQVYKEQGKIIYKGNSETAIYNSMVTEAGRQWSASLPDGTVVWLNASSSLRYPLRFTGSERLVEMTGEAYFKVVHDASKPFRVKVGNQVIEDIGTEFNINAYADEPAVKTTLVEGAASVAIAQSKVLLKPGQQASAGAGSNELQVAAVNTDHVTAWRKGKFQFEEADLHTVMRQIARWYDVEIIYEGKALNDRFTGRTFRNENLSEVLKVFELNGGVHFRIEGKKLFVRS